MKGFRPQSTRPVQTFELVRVNPGRWFGARRPRSVEVVGRDSVSLLRFMPRRGDGIRVALGQDKEPVEFTVVGTLTDLTSGVLTIYVK